MIRRIFSDLEHFRETKFDSGMNVVIADRSDGASDTESTNGLGKTTLIRIIQFCLGSDLSKDKVLNHPDLKSVMFGIDFDYQGSVISVKRHTAKGNSEVTVSSSFVDGLELDLISEDGIFKTITYDDWRRVLTLRFIARSGAGSTITNLGPPSFRELAYYYMRIGKAAFVDPKLVFQGQSGSSSRLSVSYLLSLNWVSQIKLDQKRERSAEIGKAIKVLKAAEATDLDSLGDLEADRVVLEEALLKRREEVENFNVRQDYLELEERLAAIDRQLHDLINDNHSDNRLLENYSISAKETPEADATRPINILRDAGAVFKEEALKSIAQVSEFHEQVYRNRKAFLETEILNLKAQIRTRSADIRDKTEQKTSVLSILSSSGALNSLIQLQRSLTDMTGELEALKSRIDERKKFDRQKDALAVEITATRTVLKNDLEDRRDTVDEAVALFARYTEHLYGKPAKLGIEIKTAGYGFHITIERHGSDGVEQMVVFCFDLMLATLRARKGASFDTLIHDSALFADVDPRQYGLALLLAYQEASREGFQYICCLNAGALPMEQMGELPLDDLIKLKLTDDNEHTCLLGIRLSAQEKS